jgi:hypothetical protein
MNLKTKALSRPRQACQDQPGRRPSIGQLTGLRSAVRATQAPADDVTRGHNRAQSVDQAALRDAERNTGIQADAQPIASMAKHGSKLLFRIPQEDRQMLIASLAISHGAPTWRRLTASRKRAVAVAWSQLAAGGPE